MVPPADGIQQVIAIIGGHLQALVAGGGFGGVYVFGGSGAGSGHRRQLPGIFGQQHLGTHDGRRSGNDARRQ